MIKTPQILLVGGSGRNIGKTTLAAMIIHHFCENHEIVGLKISNIKPGDAHLHGQHDGALQNNYVISEERHSGTKDSQRFLTNGAIKSFYIRTKDEHLGAAFMAFQQMVGPDTLIVCESYTLRTFVVPGVFIMIRASVNGEAKPQLAQQLQIADIIADEKDTAAFQRIISSLRLNKSGWAIV